MKIGKIFNSSVQLDNKKSWKHQTFNIIGFVDRNIPAKDKPECSYLKMSFKFMDKRKLARL